MLISLALIFLVGFSFAAIFKALKLPRIIGMLLTGVLLGPYVLNMLDSSILGISADLRQMALVIILIKAWLGALIMIFIGLLFRSVGVYLCMLGTNLNQKGRLSCTIWRNWYGFKL